MNKNVDWKAIATPLDVFDIPVPENFLRKWQEYDVTATGVVFHCEMANGEMIDFRVDVVEPDVLRVRMSLNGTHRDTSEMLIRDDWTSPPFETEERADALILTTARLRVEFQRFPWQMRVFDVQSPAAAPFFSQRVDDRAYGYAYEVPPVGFDKNENGELTARETVTVTPNESFYGFGEKFTPLDKWGHEIVSWAVDSGNVSSHRSYKNVPFFMSTAGYGLFVHSSFPIVYRMGTESNISYSFYIADSRLDYFLIYGPEFKHILHRYTDLTGRAPVPPKWSFGFWMSRAGYRSRDEVETVIREMRERDFPCDVLSLDPWWMGATPWCDYEWDTAAFPEPAQMLDNLRAQGVRTCLWITPYIPTGTDLHEEGTKRDCFIRKADGTISPVIEAFAGDELAAIDFTNPDAVKWFLSKLEKLLDMGVAVFKTDFGEQAPVDAVYHDGRSGLEMHNIYPLLYNGAVFGLTARYFGRGMTWGRSAYAGSQRYPIQWGGDSYSSLDQLACQVRALLGYGMSGVPFCSHDVGGFDFVPGFFDHVTFEEYLEIYDREELRRYPKDAETYVRWMQFGVFSSHVRAHGKQPHEPWTYGEQAEEITRRYLKLRYRLLPYIYSMAMRAAQTALPIARPLMLEYQADLNTHHLDLEYMFGDSLLVAPVVTSAKRRRVYLPAGEWVDYWTKELCAGGQWIEVDAPLEKLPLWVKAGAIIPLGPEMAHTAEKTLDPLTLEIYAPRAASELIIYDEDKPEIAVRYTCKGKKLSVEVGAAPGAVEIILYGAGVETVTLAGVALKLEKVSGGYKVHFDGTGGGNVDFLLV